MHLNKFNVGCSTKERLSNNEYRTYRISNK